MQDCIAPQIERRSVNSTVRVREPFTLLLVLCCDSDSGRWVTCAHCYHSHFHSSKVGVSSRVSFL